MKTTCNLKSKKYQSRPWSVISKYFEDFAFESGCARDHHQMVVHVTRRIEKNLVVVLWPTLGDHYEESHSLYPTGKDFIYLLHHKSKSKDSSHFSFGCKAFSWSIPYSRGKLRQKNMLHTVLWSHWCRTQFNPPTRNRNHLSSKEKGKILNMTVLK